MGAKARDTHVKAVNAALFEPLERVRVLPSLHDADGRARTVTVLLGCRSITLSVVERFMETYKPGHKVIVTGGLKVQQLSIAFFLTTSGKFGEVFDFTEAGAWKRGGLKARFTSQLCEGDYMKQQLLKRGVCAEDIVAVDDEATNTGQNIEKILKALEPYEGVHFIAFYPDAMRAMMTARNYPELKDKAISAEGVGAYTISPETWQNYYWLRRRINNQARKIGPEGSEDSYVGKFCKVIDVNAESARAQALIDKYEP